MKGKIYLNSLLVSFLLLFLHFPAEGVEEALFSNIKMNPIKGDIRAPDFSLKDLNGNKVGIKQFKGKIIFLNFWATWCGPFKNSK
jgi:thiol-disulfide isomerase/thioredoxin